MKMNVITLSPDYIAANENTYEKKSYSPLPDSIRCRLSAISSRIGSKKEEVKQALEDQTS